MYGHSDELAVAAVKRHRGEAIGDRLPGAEMLDRCVAVIGGVGPLPVRGEREGAITVAACGGLFDESGLALINIGDGQRAAGGKIAVVTPLSSVTEPMNPVITGTSLVP